MEGSQKDLLLHFYEKGQKEVEEVEFFRCRCVSLIDCRKTPVLQVNISQLFPLPLSFDSWCMHRHMDLCRIVKSSLLLAYVLFLSTLRHQMEI